ncbi:unnamed protein product [Danaus chrysippus]|uniref:(African queen) hypothetical protein n=1 Tax=Danaus chrysippus TaxID=151541 RepID=A0A8J2W482_9NEOP|nr:unnamed protein product [Danaus chrysippus]
MSVGFSISWSGPSVAKLQQKDNSPLPFILTETQVSLVASLIYAGALPGPYLMGWLSNTKGRKPCVLLGGAFGIIGYTLLALANTVMMLYFARMIIGLGVGCLVVMILVYVGEIASTGIRGTLLTVVGLFTTSGSIALYSNASFLSYYETAYAGLALFTMFTLCALMIPESPIYHVLKGNEEALKNVLQELGRSGDINEVISSKNEFSVTSNKQDWKDLVTLRSNRRSLFLSLTINVLQASSGVLAVVFFSSIIFEIAGSPLNGDVAMIIILCLQLLGTGLAVLLIEILGRRVVLYASSLMCSLAMVGIDTTVGC